MAGIKHQCPACKSKVEFVASEKKIVTVNPKPIVTFTADGKKQSGHQPHKATCPKVQSASASKPKKAKKTAKKSKSEPETGSETETKPDLD